MAVRLIGFCLATFVLLAPSGLAQDDAAKPNQKVAREILATARFLSSDALNGREAGSPSARVAAHYLASRFEGLGLKPMGDDKGWFCKFEIGENLTGRNVVGLLPGSGSDETVIVGAHFDHLGRKDKWIFNGADDNASGTAVMLAVAKALASGPKLARQVLFIAFDGEEKGLLGSRHYCKTPLVPLDKTTLMVNLDMVGRDFMDAFGTYLFLVGSDSAAGLAEIANAAVTKASGFKPLGFSAPIVDRFWASSDHRPFRKAGVPYLFFSTGMHKDYHKTTDMPAKLKSLKMARIAEAVVKVVRQTASAEKRLVFRKPKTLVTPADRAAFKVVMAPVLAFGQQMGLGEEQIKKLKDIMARVADAEKVWTDKELDEVCGELNRIMRLLSSK